MTIAAGTRWTRSVKGCWGGVVHGRELIQRKVRTWVQNLYSQLL